MNNIGLEISNENVFVQNCEVCIPIFICFEPKSREANESTIVSSSKEPLEETPQEAEGEELAECSHLLPIRIEN